MNRSWDWLYWVTLCIWTLCEVMKHVQTEYQISHNGSTHTVPDARSDIATVRTHLKAELIQEFTPNRKYNKSAVPVRDLLVTGNAYANSASAFKEFRSDPRKATNRGTKRGAPTQDPADEESDEEDSVSGDLNTDRLELNLDDLLFDDDDFPAEIDVHAYEDRLTDIINTLAMPSY